VTVLPASASIPRCTTQQFTATPKDANGHTVPGAPAPTWGTGNSAIATVSANGVATSLAVGGPIAISATIAGKTGSAQLTVNTSPIVVSWPGSAATNPPTTTTCQGQTIVWHNSDASYSHTATSTGPTGFPNTGDIQPGANSPAQPTPGAGTYTYQCIYHPQETGTVIIQ
jgi:plastocyanin